MRPKLAAMQYLDSHIMKLVGTLSMTQRRYFWLHASNSNQEKEPPIYLQLYQEIVAGTEVSDLLKGKSKEIKKGARQRLRSRIIELMADYYRERFSDTVICQYISQLAVLYEMGLREELEYMLKKGADLATKYERFGFQLEILNWEKRINLVLSSPGRSIEDIVNDEMRVIKQQQQVIVLEQLYGRAKEFKRLNGYVKGTLLDTLKNETICSKGMPAYEDCLTDRSRHYYHFIHCLYFWMVGDPNKAYEHSKAMVALPDVAINPVDYVNGILENVTSCVCLAYFEEAIRWLSSAEAFMDKHKLTQSNAFKVSLAKYNMCYLVEIYNYMGIPDKLFEAVKRTERDIERYQEYLSEEIIHVIKANLMNAYVGLGDMESAKNVFNVLYKKRSKSLRSDVYDDLFLFQIFMLLQEGIDEVVKSKVYAATRHYRTFEDYECRFHSELELMKILLDKNAFLGTNMRLRTLYSIKDCIKKEINVSSKTQYQERLSFYLIWIESIISGDCFTKVANRQYLELAN